MAYGVTTEGFVGKPIEVARAELEAGLRLAFGAGINLAPQSQLAKIVGLFADREASIWDLGEAIYLAFTADGASDAQLDNVLGLTGAVRLGAVRSTVTATVTGDEGTTLTIGRVASVPIAGTRFQTLAEVVLVAVDAWIAHTPYALDARVTLGSRVYQCVAAGTSGGTGPVGTAADITDGTAHWRYLGGGVAAADVACEGEVTGPAQAVSGTLTQIETPVSGWHAMINVLDAVPGRDLETDAAARLRREELLAESGSSVVDAIRADVRRVAGVTTVRVFENTTDFDAGGLPPHSVEIVVLGGDDATIAQAIWDSKPAGIRAYGGGSDSGTALDSEAAEHVVAFTRPTEVPIYVACEARLDALTWPGNDALTDLLKAAIVAGGNTLGLGKSVYSTALSARCFKPGVVDIEIMRIGTAPSPGSSSPITIGPREIARFDTSRVDVSYGEE